MKRTLTALAIAALSIAPAAFATGKPGAVVTIRHQTLGCHSWAVNDGGYASRQTVHLTLGQTLTVTNNDVMPHQLVGPKGLAIGAEGTPKGGGTGPLMKGRSTLPGMMNFMGATVRLTFGKAGVYRFTTKAGEDYIAGVKTVGEDNVLRLTVVVG